MGKKQQLKHSYLLETKMREDMIDGDQSEALEDLLP